MSNVARPQVAVIEHSAALEAGKLISRRLAVVRGEIMELRGRAFRTSGGIYLDKSMCVMMIVLAVDSVSIHSKLGEHCFRFFDVADIHPTAGPRSFSVEETQVGRRQVFPLSFEILFRPESSIRPPALAEKVNELGVSRPVHLSHDCQHQRVERRSLLQHSAHAIVRRGHFVLTLQAANLERRLLLIASCEVDGLDVEHTAVVEAKRHCDLCVSAGAGR